MKIKASDVKNWLVYSPSPQKTALAFTLGFYLGLFPVIGCTTILCILAIFVFKLNPLMVQGMNVLLSPIQMALMYPVLKLGRILFFTKKDLFPEVSFKKMLIEDGWDSLYYLIESFAGGIVVWALFSTITGYFLYRLLLKVKSRFPLLSTR